MAWRARAWRGGLSLGPAPGGWWRALCADGGVVQKRRFSVSGAPKRRMVKVYRGEGA